MPNITGWRRTRKLNENTFSNKISATQQRKWNANNAVLYKQPENNLIMFWAQSHDVLRRFSGSVTKVFSNLPRVCSVQKLKASVEWNDALALCELAKRQVEKTFERKMECFFFQIGWGKEDGCIARVNIADETKCPFGIKAAVNAAHVPSKLKIEIDRVYIRDGTFLQSYGGIRGFSTVLQFMEQSCLAQNQIKRIIKIIEIYDMFNKNSLIWSQYSPSCARNQGRTKISGWKVVGKAALLLPYISMVLLLWANSKPFPMNAAAVVVFVLMTTKNWLFYALLIENNLPLCISISWLQNSLIVFRYSHARRNRRKWRKLRDDRFRKRCNFLPRICNMLQNYRNSIVKFEQIRKWPEKNMKRRKSSRRMGGASLPNTMPIR